MIPDSQQSPKTETEIIMNQEAESSEQPDRIFCIWYKFDNDNWMTSGIGMTYEEAEEKIARFKIQPNWSQRQVLYEIRSK